MILKRKRRWFLKTLALAAAVSITVMLLPGASASPAQEETEAAPQAETAYDATAGDLVAEELQSVTLSRRALPEGMDYEEAVADGHRQRLYAQEEGLNAVIFQNADASKTLYVFQDAVKYETAKGEIRDIDNEIITQPQNAQYAFRNKASDLALQFGRRLPQGVLAEYESFSLSLAVAGAAEIAPETDSETVTYPGAFGAGTALRYTPTVKGFKEDIVLEEYTGQSEFCFVLDIGEENELRKSDDDCLYVVERATGETKALIEPVWIIDAQGKVEKENGLSYAKKPDGSWELTVTANSAFLADEATVYPVSIDPTVTIQKSTDSTGIQDVTLYSNTAKPSDGASGSLFVGNRSGFGNSRVLMKIPGLSLQAILNTSQITSARVSLRDLMCEAESVSIGCYAFTGNTWAESTANWSNVSPDSYSTADAATQAVSYSRGVTLGEQHRYWFDITAIVRKWLTGAYSQAKGVLFKSTNESQAAFKTFGSYNRSAYNPSFVMDYTSSGVTPYGRSIGDGDYYVVNRSTGKVFDLSGSQAIQYPINGGRPQVWKFTYNSVTGLYSAVPWSDTSKHLYNNNGSAQLTASGSAPYWHVESAGNGYYKIKQERTNFALTADGTNLTVSSSDNRVTQQWQFVKKFVKGKAFDRLPDSSTFVKNPAYYITGVTESWQQDTINSSISKWNKTPEINIQIGTSPHAIDATADVPYSDDLGNLLGERTNTGNVVVYYDSIKVYVDRKAPMDIETLKNALTKNSYLQVCTHELGHALGLAHPSGTSERDSQGLILPYSILRYPWNEGHHPWEMYWGTGEPQLADIVGVCHPEV